MDRCYGTTPGDSLDSVPEDSSLSYGNLVKLSSKEIELAKKAYSRALKKLKKGFRKDRRTKKKSKTKKNSQKSVLKGKIKGLMVHCLLSP